MEWNRGNLAGNNWYRGEDAEQFKCKNKQRERISEQSVLYRPDSAHIYIRMCSRDERACPVCHIVHTLLCYKYSADGIAISETQS